MKTLAYGIPWIPVSMLEGSLKSKWKILDYTNKKLSYDEVNKAKPDVIVAFSPPEDIIDNSNIKWVISPGAGVDGMNLELINERGQVIVNTHGNSITVAEHAWALLMAAARKIIKYDSIVREQEAWPSSRQIFDMNIDLNGKTIGILGYGAIGQKLEKMAKAFEMDVKIVRNNAEEGQYFDYELIEIAGDLDFLIVACPLTSKTKGLVSKEVIAKLPSNAILVNVGRGAVVDEPALFDALHEGTINAAAIDTWVNSPYRKEGGIPPTQFINVPNLLISSHRAWVSKDSFGDVIEQIAFELDLIAKGKNPSSIYDFSHEY